MRSLVRAAVVPVLLVASLASAQRLRRTDESQPGMEMPAFALFADQSGVRIDLFDFYELESPAGCEALWDDVDTACSDDEPDCEPLAETYDFFCAPPWSVDQAGEDVLFGVE